MHPCNPIPGTKSSTVHQELSGRKTPGNSGFGENGVEVGQIGVGKNGKKKKCPFFSYFLCSVLM